MPVPISMSRRRDVPTDDPAVTSPTAMLTGLGPGVTDVTDTYTPGVPTPPPNPPPSAVALPGATPPAASPPPSGTVSGMIAPTAAQVAADPAKFAGTSWDPARYVGANDAPGSRLANNPATPDAPGNSTFTGSARTPVLGDPLNTDERFVYDYMQGSPVQGQWTPERIALFQRNAGTAASQYRMPTAGAAVAAPNLRLTGYSSLADFGASPADSPAVIQQKYDAWKAQGNAAFAALSPAANATAALTTPTPPPAGNAATTTPNATTTAATLSSTPVTTTPAATTTPTATTPAATTNVQGTTPGGEPATRGVRDQPARRFRDIERPHYRGWGPPPGPPPTMPPTTASPGGSLPVYSQGGDDARIVSPTGGGAAPGSVSSMLSNTGYTPSSTPAGMSTGPQPPYRPRSGSWRPGGSSYQTSQPQTTAPSESRLNTMKRPRPSGGVSPDRAFT